MRFLFCKKSVFSILFLISFLLGTTCGVLLFRYIHVAHRLWISDYGLLLASVSSAGILLRLLFVLVPFFALYLLGLFSEGFRMVPFLIAVRGCILAYYFSCCYVSGISVRSVIIKNIVLLPLYYYFSGYIWVNCPFDRYKL